MRFSAIQVREDGQWLYTGGYPRRPGKTASKIYAAAARHRNRQNPAIVLVPDDAVFHTSGAAASQ